MKTILQILGIIILSFSLLSCNEELVDQAQSGILKGKVKVETLSNNKTVILGLKEEDWNKKDDDGCPLICFAYVAGKFDLCRDLIKREPVRGLESYACQMEDKKKLRESIYKLNQRALEKNRWSDLFSPMPFTGENVLHLAIIAKDVEMVRWLLGFYRDYDLADIARGGPGFALACLLSEPVYGSMMQKDSSSYYGSLPLHFAASSGSTEIFDLVLTYAESINVNRLLAYKRRLDNVMAKTSEGNKSLHDIKSQMVMEHFDAKGYSMYNVRNETRVLLCEEEFAYLENIYSSKNEKVKPKKYKYTYTMKPDSLEHLKFILLSIITRSQKCLGRNSLFARDFNGSNLLHLCAAKCQKDMFDHIYSKANESIRNYLIFWEQNYVHGFKYQKDEKLQGSFLSKL